MDKSINSLEKADVAIEIVSDCIEKERNPFLILYYYAWLAAAEKSVYFSFSNDDAKKKWYLKELQKEFTDCGFVNFSKMDIFKKLSLLC